MSIRHRLHKPRIKVSQWLRTKECHSHTHKEQYHRKAKYLEEHLLLRTLELNSQNIRPSYLISLSNPSASHS